MSIALLYLACPVIAYVSYVNLIATHSVLSSIVISVILAYLPTYAVTNHLSKHGGFQQTWFQKLAYWKRFNRKLLRGELVCEEKLDSKKQYIFGNFPHGTCSVNHVLTMTDCCGMISEHYTGERRDLAASVLFLVPIVKEVIWWLISFDCPWSINSDSLSFILSVSTFSFCCCLGVSMLVPLLVTTTWSEDAQFSFSWVERKNSSWPDLEATRSTFWIARALWSSRCSTDVIWCPW